MVKAVRVTENMEMKATAGMSPWGAPEPNGNGLPVSRGDKPGWGGQQGEEEKDYRCREQLRRATTGDTFGMICCKGQRGLGLRHGEQRRWQCVRFSSPGCGCA